MRSSLCSAAALWVVGALVVAGCGRSAEIKLTEDQNLFVESQKALEAGDTQRALELLTSSIEANPTRYAHYNRARLYEQLGEDEKALADCAAALALQPEDEDVLWLQGELNKPKKSRFKGRFANPPSASK